MPKQAASTVSQKPYNLDPNVEAVLAYLISPFTGVAVFVMEKNNKFVRFHAMQSILFGVASFVLMAIANALIAVLVGVIIAPLLSLALFLTWLFIMWKAYQNEEFMLPVIGQVAKDQVNKTTKA